MSVRPISRWKTWNLLSLHCKDTCKAHGLHGLNCNIKGLHITLIYLTFKPPIQYFLFLFCADGPSLHCTLSYKQQDECIRHWLEVWFSPITDGHFTGTPPSYGYDADRAEEQRRHHDILPYIDDSPSSSPHLSSKSRSSRDTLSSGSLESSKSVSVGPEWFS